MNFDIDPRDINLQGPDGMQLVKLLRGLIEEIDSGGDVPVPVVDSEIFYCTYNQTSGAEISQALSNGLLPVCKYNTKVYYLVSTVPPYTFVSFDRTNYNMYLLTCIGTTWSMPIRYLQERLEFDYTPTQGSTNPITSGGVYTAIQQGGGGSDIDPYQQYPEMDGVASPGNSDDYARGNHVHPTDTSRAAASEITRIDAALAGKADQASIQQTIEDTVDEWLTAQAPSIGTLSYAAKQALLACFRKVAWIDNQGQSYYDALERELFPDATLESITAVFTQGSATIYDTDSLDTLKQYLTVTANYSDSTTETVTGYILSGTLTAGTSTITVNYNGKADTFNVTVTRLEIKVFRGKGTSGAAIADNTNRALSEPVAFENEAPITIQWDSYSTIKMGFKNTTTNTNVIDTTGIIIVPIERLGKVYSGDDGWLATTAECAIADVSNSYIYAYVYPTTSGYARLLFANSANMSQPLPSTPIDGVIHINGIPYHLVETPVSEFE